MIVKFNKTKAHQVYKLADGTRVPGGSTIAKVAGAYEAQGPLIAWANREGLEGRDCGKTRDKAADVGTLAHWLIECHLKGNQPDTSEFSKSDLDLAENAALKFMSWWDQNGFTLLASEVQLVSEQYRFGGTLDIVAMDRQKRVVLVDIKTSKRINSEHWYQVAGYRKLWDEKSDNKISRVAICRVGRSDNPEDWELVEKGGTDQYFRVFLCGLNLYNAVKECK